MAAELPPDLMEKVQLALGNCWLATDNLAEALASFATSPRNDKSPLLAEAVIAPARRWSGKRIGPRRSSRLELFRDQGPFQNVPGVSDRRCSGWATRMPRRSSGTQSRQA